MKWLRILSALLLIAGVSLTARATYVHIKAQLAGVLIRRAWQQSLRAGNPIHPWPWADAHPIARLQIPRIGYDEIVLDSATPRTLAFGPALLRSGAPLGKPGNVVLAGHRTSWFLPLQEIAAGDQIQLEWFDSRHSTVYQRTYTVEAIRIVEPRDVSLLAPTTQDALTLITCYPFGRSPTSPQRYIVRATPQSPGHPTFDPHP
jgi:sortase A